MHKNHCTIQYLVDIHSTNKTGRNTQAAKYTYVCNIRAGSRVHSTIITLGKPLVKRARRFKVRLEMGTFDYDFFLLYLTSTLKLGCRVHSSFLHSACRVSIIPTSLKRNEGKSIGFDHGLQQFTSSHDGSRNLNI